MATATAERGVMIGGKQVKLSTATIAPGGTYMVGVSKSDKAAVVALLTARDRAWAPSNMLPSMGMFSATLSQQQLQVLLADARVKYVEADGNVSVLPVAPGPKKGLEGDYGNVALLLLLYTLQGIPMGLAGSIPMMLSERGVSYTEQAKFSLVSWPFSLKLLWAPIVDSVYLERWGRRKSWLVPVQFITALAMLGLSTQVDAMLGDPDQKAEGAKPVQVMELTVAFFFLFFLMATQDIAVDGWALTMLQEHNIGYQATCNAVGQTFGYFVSLTGLLALQSWGMVTLSQFMAFWGVVFLVVTIGIVFLKQEKSSSPADGEDDGEPKNVVEAYTQMQAVIALPAVRYLLLMLFTWKVGFAASDSITHLKLQEYGLPKEHMAYIGTLITPVEILLPMLISKYTTGPRPLSLCLGVYLPRLLLGIAVAGAVFVHPFPLQKDAAGALLVPWSYYGGFYVLLLLHAALSTAMFVAQMSFFSSVADSTIGGTYMTLLNTAANLGSKWPSTLVLASTDYASTLVPGVDGYFLLVGGCTALGMLWLVMMKSHVQAFEAYDRTQGNKHWSVRIKKSKKTT